ncbi:MAG TPA: GxxExxY protein [Gemmata sp.]|nr:GxxExxY protein [Gemmata sp.]
MTINEISGLIVDAPYKIHTTLGPGLLETVYEAVLEKELIRRGLRVRRQVPVPISFDGLKFDEGFRADLLVEDCIVVELKSVEQLHPVHAKQVLTYCKLLNYRLGLLINFGAALIKDGIKRIANGVLRSFTQRRGAAESLRTACDLPPLPTGLVSTELA